MKVGISVRRLNSTVVASLVFLTLFCLTVRLSAQVSGEEPKSSSQTKAPLELFTTGSGRIIPYQNGQMLSIGKSYTMTAIPDRGYAFAGWNRVNVFIFIETFSDGSGNLATSIHTVVSPIGEWIKKRPLQFQVQPGEVIFDQPRVRTIVQRSGWQANFVRTR